MRREACLVRTALHVALERIVLVFVHRVVVAVRFALVLVALLPGVLGPVQVVGHDRILHLADLAEGRVLRVAPVRLLRRLERGHVLQHRLPRLLHLGIRIGVRSVRTRRATTDRRVCDAQRGGRWRRWLAARSNTPAGFGSAGFGGAARGLIDLFLPYGSHVFLSGAITLTFGFSFGATLQHRAETDISYMWLLYTGDMAWTNAAATSELRNRSSLSRSRFLPFLLVQTPQPARPASAISGSGVSRWEVALSFDFGAASLSLKDKPVARGCGCSSEGGVAFVAFSFVIERQGGMR